MLLAPAAMLALFAQPPDKDRVSRGFAESANARRLVCSYPTMTHQDAQYKPGESASQLLSINEVGALLGVSRDTVYRVIAREVPTYRVGERLRFRAEDVDEYVERNRAS